MPSGPPPTVSATLNFGESPVEGFVTLRPSFETRDWRYEVDLDEDGIVDHEGALDVEVAFMYRFTVPGVHRVRVTLQGPDSIQNVEIPVSVNDPEAIRVVAQRAAIELGEPGSFNSFEGITTNRAGSIVYIADFSGLDIYSLRAGDLEQLAAPLELTLLLRGLAGLSIPPSDTSLYVAHKDLGLSVVAIPRMELLRSIAVDGHNFIYAVDDSTALMPGGQEDLNLNSTRTGVSIRTLGVADPGHFSVSKSATLVAVIGSNGLARAIRLASMPGLLHIARVDLPEGLDPEIVAFDPSEDALFVMARGADGDHFVLVDLRSRTVVYDLRLGNALVPRFCCFANPVAMSADGRYVAMERDSGVYFIDTALDLPLFHTSIGNSVAASPTEDVFYLLRPDGLVSKVAISPIIYRSSGNRER
jgi:hypothetical protein